MHRQTRVSCVQEQVVWMFVVPTTMEARIIIAHPSTIATRIAGVHVTIVGHERVYAEASLWLARHHLSQNPCQIKRVCTEDRLAANNANAGR